MNFVMKEKLVQSDLVLVLLSFDYFLLNIYKTFANTCIYIKALQIQGKYIIQ